MQILRLYLHLPTWKLDTEQYCKSLCLVTCKDLSMNLCEQVRNPVQEKEQQKHTPNPLNQITRNLENNINRLEF